MSLKGLGFAVLLSVFLSTGCATRWYNTQYRSFSSELYQAHEIDCNASIEVKYIGEWKRGGKMKFWTKRDTTEGCMERKGWVKTY